MKPQSRRNVLGLLGAILETAKKRAWTTANPVADYEKPRKPRSEADELRFLTLEELEAVLRAMPDDDLGRVERALALTAAMTGTRRGELLGLRWKDVDWAAHKIRVVRTFVGGREDTPKSEQSRRDVPLADRVAAELQRLWDVTPFKADEDPVFAQPRGTGLPRDGSAVSKRFQLALRRAGVRRVRFHDLRHTFGTTARDPRVSMRTLQGWLGHADPATTAIYGALRAERATRGVDSAGVLAAEPSRGDHDCAAVVGFGQSAILVQAVVGRNRGARYVTCSHSSFDEVAEGLRGSGIGDARVGRFV